MCLKDKIIHRLTDGPLTVTELVKQLPTYNERQIKNVLYTQLQDQVVIVEKRDKTPVWGLKSPSIKERPSKKKSSHKLKYYYNKQFRSQSSPEGCYISERSPIDSKEHHLIAVDLDSCRDLIPVINEIIENDPMAIVRGFTILNKFGNPLKFDYDVAHVPSWSYMQHWISRCTADLSRNYDITIVSHDNLMKNLADLLRLEGWNVLVTSDQKQLKSLI